MESPNLDVGLGSIFTALEFFLIFFLLDSGTYMATFEIDFLITSPLKIVKGSKEKWDPIVTVGKEFLRKGRI